MFISAVGNSTIQITSVVAYPRKLIKTKDHADHYIWRISFKTKTIFFLWLLNNFALIMM